MRQESENRHVYFTGEKEAKVIVKVKDFPISMVIDSGCPVTILNGDTYASSLAKGLVEEGYKNGGDVKFFGYETHRRAIEIKGSVLVNLTHDNIKVTERIYIAPYGRVNLLGKLTSEKLL